LKKDSVSKLKRIFKKIVKELSVISDTKLIILYGSFARGDYGPKSDIDLFILTTKQKTLNEIQNKIISIEEKIGKSIQPTIRTEKELKKTDIGLLQNLLQEGKLLYLKEPFEISVSEITKQKPYVIYTFELNSLNQKTKAKFNRELYARTKEKHVYQGLLQEIGGQKLSPGCIIIPFDKKNIVEKFFRRYKIKYEAKNVWK